LSIDSQKQVFSILFAYYSLENAARTKELSRVSPIFSMQSAFNRITELQKPTSPMKSSQQNPLVDLMQNNSAIPFISPSQPVSPDKSKESEMNV
jgi:hypothetical protein